MEIATNEEMKEEAIRRLKTLDIFNPYIRKFASKSGIPTFFENYAGFYADQENGLIATIKSVENRYGYLVYALTHERVNGDETWSMLVVSKYKDDWEYELESLGGNRFRVFSYVHNADVQEFSEAGDIGVAAFGGGLKRIF